MFHAVVLQGLQDNFGARHLIFCSAHRISVRLFGISGVINEFLGIKKGPLEEPAYRAWVLSPDGYTTLPMRLPTTRMIAVSFFMGRSVTGKARARQRLSACFETARIRADPQNCNQGVHHDETSY
ncbi:hypothetical protein AB3G45_13685 [Shinella sp. S4-D37]|uniref:hypothetical protein n=1 Tax=Shinella sp. S4-D37 TaxID=3161999 RepID=UPI003466CE0D